MQAMHLPAAEIALRSEGFYKQHDIEMKLGKEVSIDHVSEYYFDSQYLSTR